MRNQHLASAVLSLAVAALIPAPAAAQSTSRVSVDSNGVQGNGDCTGSSTSADGRFIAFESLASILVFGDTNLAADIFLKDRQTGQTTRVSVDSAGVEAEFGGKSPSISADGRFVAFWSASTNLVAGDLNGVEDMFVHDSQTGQTTRVSVDSAGVEGNKHCTGTPSISADGRLVAFASYASNLVPGDTNVKYDIFVHDRLTGQTSRVSVNDAGVQGNSESWRPAISADGLTVAFESYASNLVAHDTNGFSDVFVHDRLTGRTSRVSLNSAGGQGHNDSSRPSLSADGLLVAFSSYAADLVPADTNGYVDAFVHDRTRGQTTRVSVDSAGAQANGSTFLPLLAADGRNVVFVGQASNLVPDDTNHRADIFVKHLPTGRISRASVDSAGVQGTGASDFPSISADGRVVAFSSASPFLVSFDTNNALDVFVRDGNLVRPSLALTGACPGPITLTISEATANGRIAVVCGPAGTYVKGTPPCLGLILGLRSPFAGRTHVFADDFGTAVLNLSVPAGACGLSVQAVDVTSCTATNVIVL